MSSQSSAKACADEAEVESSSLPKVPFVTSGSETNFMISAGDLQKDLHKSAWMTSERLNELRKKVQEAVKAHKIFTVRGQFNTVRRALYERGWIEKFDTRKLYGGSGYILIDELVQNLPSRKPGESKKAFITKCERSVMSRFLENVTVDLLWTARREKSDYFEISKNNMMLVNRFSKAPFSSKEGLTHALKEFYWFYEEGISETFYPRCYNVWNPEEFSDFTEDFRLTACISLLKFVVYSYFTSGKEMISDSDGRVSLSCISFALDRCNEYVEFRNHTEIDKFEETDIWDHDWDVYFTNHYLLTHEGAKFKTTNDDSELENLILASNRMLDEVRKFCPQYNLDGYLNIWIIKPANKCRGRGIQLMNNIKQIVSMVNPPIITKTRYVVQKYIERPLIIHNTKFDIRQWFLISSVQPLIIWFYKDSYLRFSSQHYSLNNYHESVHLTNYAIQKKYQNAQRDERLPHENMWDCHTFQAYLRQIGKSEMWHQRIYPGMQKAITGTMLACQDNMDRRPNTFELFGADFMVSEDFYPWLIEINSSPDLTPSTSVTARLCPQCVEDTIKVMIDRKFDLNADTGTFVQIYKQYLPKAPAYMGLNLSLRGHRIVPKSSRKEKMRTLPCRSLQNFMQLTRADSSLRHRQHSPVIMDLIDCLSMKTKHEPEPDCNVKKLKRHLIYKRPITLSSLSRAKVGQKRSLLQHEQEVAHDIRCEYIKQLSSSGSKNLLESVDDIPSCNYDSDQAIPLREFICLGNKLQERCGSSAKSATLEETKGSPSANGDSLYGEEAKIVPFHKCKNIDSDITTIRVKLRRNPFSINKENTVKAENSRGSHFYAVGLSLKAWRDKYNCILKTKQDTVISNFASAKTTHFKMYKRSPEHNILK